MSAKATSWALKQPISHSPAKFVLVAMAERARDDMLVWPSISALEADTAQNRKTIVANIKRLVEWGYLEDTGDRVGQTRSVAVYRLKEGSSHTKTGTASNVGNLPKAVPSLELLSSTDFGSSTSFGTSPKMSGKQSQNVTEAVPKSSTEPKDKTLKDKNIKEGATPSLSVSDLEGLGVNSPVAKEFLALRKRKRAALTQLAMQGIQREATCAGWSLDAALTKCVERGWQSFEAAWVQGRPGSPGGGLNKQEALEASNRAIAERLSRAM